MGADITNIAKVTGFGHDFGIDIFDDIQGMGRVSARLIAANGSDKTATHIVDDYNADYYAARVDYSRGDRIVGSRAIAVIMAGHRTKLAYWPTGGKAKKILIHQGQGHLIIGNPQDGDLDGSFNTRYFVLDADTTPSVMLQPGMFYTFEAAAWSTLVISAISKTDESGSWGITEIPFEPGTQTIKTPGGIVAVPDEFIFGEFD
jgi:hypothetical protein